MYFFRKLHYFRDFHICDFPRFFVTFNLTNFRKFGPRSSYCRVDFLAPLRLGKVCKRRAAETERRCVDTTPAAVWIPITHHRHHHHHHFAHFHCFLFVLVSEFIFIQCIFQLILYCRHYHHHKRHYHHHHHYHHLVTFFIFFLVFYILYSSSSFSLTCTLCNLILLSF